MRMELFKIGASEKMVLRGSFYADASISFLFSMSLYDKTKEFGSSRCAVEREFHFYFTIEIREQCVHILLAIFHY